MDQHDFQDDRLARLVRQAVEREVITLGRGGEILDLPLEQMRDRASSWRAFPTLGAAEYGLFLVDANVLFDYANTYPTVLTLVARRLGPVHVPEVVLDEVEQLDEDACDRLALVVVEGTLEQILEAGDGGLSFPDWMCLILARDEGWTCVTKE